MYSVYNLDASELDENFWKGIKKQCAGKHIEITVETLDDNMDTTEFLLSDPENKKQLLKSIKNVEERKNLVEVSWDDIK